MANSINTVRHFSHFDPAKSPTVTVIGCGATGSKIALSLAKLGIEELSLYDGDNVESHNISNQVFSLKHVGMPKVKALEELIYESTTLKVEANVEMFEAQKVSGIVFLLTDTMKSRKDIMSKFKMSPSIKCVIETRMGVDEGRIYCFNPVLDYDRWMSVSNYDDEQSEESACGSKSSVGPTADIISGFAVWQYMKFVNNQDPEFEFIFTVRPNIGFMTTP